MIKNRLPLHRQHQRLPRLVLVVIVVVIFAVTAYALVRSSSKAHYPVNPPTFLVQRSHGYYLEHMIHRGSDDLLLLLTFSGGGTRAAALAYGVLEVLRDIVVENPPYTTEIPDDGRILQMLSLKQAEKKSGKKPENRCFGIGGRKTFLDATLIYGKW